MTLTDTSFRLRVRRTAPAAATRSVCHLQIDAFSDPCKPRGCRPRALWLTPAPLRGVHSRKTGLPHLLKTRYKFHPC